MTKDEAREAALLAACGLEPDHGTFGAECRFSRTVVDYMFDAGYDFAKSEDRWNVIERDGLPDAGKLALWTSDAHSTPMIGYLVASGVQPRRVNRKGGGSFEYLESFIAWRPLPEPYKEDASIEAEALADWEAIQREQSTNR